MTFFAVTGLFCALLASQMEDSASRERAGAALRNGSALMQEARYQEARDQFVQATKEDPRSAEAFFFLGTAEVQLHQPAAAESALRHSLALDATSANTLYNLGVLLLERKRPREALPYFERASRIDPASIEICVNLIRAQLDAGYPERALHAVDASLPDVSNSPAFNLAAAKSFLAHGMPEQATGFLKKADASMPSQQEVLLPLAEACLQSKDSACAQDALQRVSGEARESASFHFLEARAAFLAGGKDEALAGMAAALQQEPRNVRYLVTLAEYCQKYGNQARAVQLLEKAQQLAPGLADIPYGLAVSHFIDDDFDGAIAYLNQALKLRPGSDRALFLLALSRFAQGKFSEAKLLLDRGMRLDADNPFYPCFRGMIFLSTQQVAAAMTDFRSAIRIRPSYALPHYQLARAMARLDDFQGARTELERAISLDPDLKEAYYQLFLVYRRLGEREKASETLAIFEKYRSAKQNERTEILREAQQAVQDNR